MRGSKTLKIKQTAGGPAVGPKKPTLLLVESHRFLREIFNQMLADERDLEIVGQAEDGVQAITEAVRLLPELVVMDLWLPDMSGLAVTRLIRELVPQAKVILLIEEACREYTEAVLESGAQGYVVKTMAGRELTSALAEAMARKQP